MILLTAASIGVFAYMLRSPLACIATAVMIAITFVAAGLNSPLQPSLSQLLLAYLGYNAGLAAGILTMTVLGRARVARGMSDR